MKYEQLYELRWDERYFVRIGSFCSILPQEEIPGATTATSTVYFLVFSWAHKKIALRRHL
jgi:hypothetical protein